ncbi:hypothetical protein GGS23DRAFT_589001 [Durotheca rogersii]|uniref:uncharacterized protein n=1 Tax=Durotheca rogersii TaxID=419775 RepID=UPI00221F4B0F|nr:uncharacterized protein GGS23DRAFT_589001 [Durotheca rogersii]KAI5856646.1 hypothetical protein GGS23DRAFT_589001 [Durotheca rogersii]
MDSMDLDVEMDVDVDLVPDEPIVLDPEPQDTCANRSPGEIEEPLGDEVALVPGKIHVRGLDVMNSDEVSAYVAEHFSNEPIERIEWIDDTSANLLFSSHAAATRALTSLAVEDIRDIHQLPRRKLMPAKSFSKRPDVRLQVRLTVGSDKKQAGAASRSRFYLLNPEFDPEERRRRERRYRERDGSKDYGHARARDSWYPVVDDQFDVSLYDDDQAALAGRNSQPQPRRRSPHAPDTTDGHRAERNVYRDDNRGKELFPDGPGDRSRSRRNRSASPARDRQSNRKTDYISSSGSSSRNRDRAHAIKSRSSQSTRARQLFPEKSSAGTGHLKDDVNDALTSITKGMMLSLDETSAELGDQDRRPGNRITIPGKDRIATEVLETDAGDATGTVFSIRGTASRTNSHQGFAIRGSAGKSAKELFPEKFGINAGKELFSDRLEGKRSRPRQRARDLFD